MYDLLSGLYCTLIEDIHPPKGDPEYEQAMQAYLKLEAQVKEKIGLELLNQYQQARNNALHWEDIAIFTRGLRFGVRFTLEVLC